MSFRALIEGNLKLLQGTLAIIGIATGLGITAAVVPNLPVSHRELDARLGEERRARIAYEDSARVDRQAIRAELQQERRQMAEGFNLIGTIAMDPESPEAKAAQVQLRKMRRINFNREGDE